MTLGQEGSALHGLMINSLLSCTSFTLRFVVIAMNRGEEVNCVDTMVDFSLVFVHVLVKVCGCFTEDAEQLTYAGQSKFSACQVLVHISLGGHGRHMGVAWSNFAGPSSSRSRREGVT